MFGLFDKKDSSVKPYHPQKDLGEAGYKSGIELLAKSSSLEWLSSNKMNSEILLASQDMSQKKDPEGKPAQRLRAMIEKMSEGEYAEWVKTVVFH